MLDIYLSYLSLDLVELISCLSDTEFGSDLWHVDMDLDMDSHNLRDMELILDLTGNLDSYV
jgi:hypothetical protein